MAKGRIKPTYAQSLKFLQQWAPEGPWVLTAIDPDKRAIDTTTFRPESEDRMMTWLEKQGAKRNIYFTVNPVTRDLDSKPAREHIRELAWLHVDLDPRAGEDIDDERMRIRALLGKPDGKGLPKPTVITFSGGGYQGFWKLKEPLRLDGSAEDYEEAKRYNKQVEILLGGDNCHNVDRIMRLPGTVNRPDRRKRSKGRTEALAKVEVWNGDEYDLSEFTKAPKVQGGQKDSGLTGQAGYQVEVSGNVQRFSSVDEIKELKDRPQCRVVIVQGLDPDDPDKFKGSRSEWLFFVCCEMVRAGCSDDVIYSVITDPDFKISDSVYTDSLGEAQKGWEEYALRQIQRAHEEAVDPILRELNDTHAVIGSIGSKGHCRILAEELDSRRGRTRIAYQTKSDFMLRYADRWIEFPVGNGGKTIRKPAALWWLENPLRRFYNTVEFFPGGQTPGNYNLWTGFSVEAVPGDCGLYLQHIHDNICDGNTEVSEWLISWMAWTVQEPANPGQVAVILRGEQGTGKGVFANGFGSLWGRHFLPVSDTKHLVGSFNAHMRDCVVMFADEAFAAQDKRAEALLKTLVTEDTITVEAKGVDAESAPNYIHLIMASNNDWVIPAGAHERRFLMLEVGNDKRQDGAYFAAIEEELANGGREALLHFLMTRDLTGFNPRVKPHTKALEKQQEFSMTPEEDWWYDKLNEGEVFAGEGWPAWVYCSHLLYDFTERMRVSSFRGRVSATRLKRFLERVTAGNLNRTQQWTKDSGPVSVIQQDGMTKEVARPYIFELPSLDACWKFWKDSGHAGKQEEPTASKLPYEETGPTGTEGEVFG